MPEATYLLPIKAAEPPGDELTDYLREVSGWMPVVIVDGSPEPVFRSAHRTWSTFAVHVPPEPALRFANGKVSGVLTGLLHVATPAVVIADDDVRYTATALRECIAALDAAHLVRPQNHFEPVPWHAAWDTGRALLNRLVGGDHPGTMAVRTSVLAAGYDGDVMFENLQLMRTVEARGGRCVHRPDIYVRRLPPTTRHFLGQRVRQAYDELARPARLAVQLALAPSIAACALRRPRALPVAAAAVAGAAEVGRRRWGGRQHFPARASLMAPLWVVERAVCSWLAVGARLRGGIRYNGRRIVRAATRPPVARGTRAGGVPVRSAMLWRR